MGASCSIIPKVKNTKTGAIEESNLFKEIQNFSDTRYEQRRIYISTKTPQMKERLKDLEVDDNGEPLFSELRKVEPYNKIYSEDYVKTQMEKKAGFSDKEGKTVLKEDTFENRQDSEDKAVRYNDAHPGEDYLAIPVRTSSREGEPMTGVRLFSNNNKIAATAERMKTNHSLNNRLREILSGLGINVGTLNELEERLGIKGITDFSLAKAAANGLLDLIRLSNDEEGERALPEEFAHFAIAALIGENLVSRTINQIKENGLASEILGDAYERYYLMYAGDDSLLAEEAAGKLLAMNLNKVAYSTPASLRTLLGRMISRVKDFFRGVDPKNVRRAMIDADASMGTLAKRILRNELSYDISRVLEHSNRSLYSLASEAEKANAVLEKTVDNLSKRAKLYEKRTGGERYSTRIRTELTRIESLIEHGQTLQAMSAFVQLSIMDMKMINERMGKVIALPSEDLNYRSRVMRDARDFIYSYSSIVNYMRDAVIESIVINGENEDDNMIKKLLDETILLINDSKILYRRAAMPLFVEFLKPYLGDGLEVPFGKYKGKVYTAEELVREADRDVGFIDRWLLAMSENSDMLLKIFDQAVKEAKDKARLQDIEDEKELVAAGLALEEAGYSDFEWMFERDENGNLTGKYIQEINYDAYKKAYMDMLANLKSKYGESPEGIKKELFERDRKAWIADNCIWENGKRKPNVTKYANPGFLSLSQAQRNFYDKILEIKARKDAMLPEGTTSLFNAPKILKDFVERTKEKGLGTAMKEGIKDQFIRRSDDTDLSVKPTLMDFEGREVQILPIYYTKMHAGENMNDMSTDVVTTMIAYSSMANNYNEMSRIIDILENGRDLLLDEENGREIASVRGGRQLVERFMSLGKMKEKKITKRGQSSRFAGRLNDYFSMQIYNHYYADEGTFLGMEVSKIAETINMMTALHTFALNLMAGISNAATGSVMMRVDSYSHQFFTPGNVRYADKTYISALGEYMDDIGARANKSKLALWDELFNVLQDHETRMMNKDFNKKNFFARMLKTNTLYFLEKSGDHWMYNRTALALADTMKFNDNGTEINLWDAYEKVNIDDNNPKRGAKLVMKRGLVDTDGNRIITREELKERAVERTNIRPTDKSLLGEKEVSEYDLIRKYSRKAATISERLYGVYNKIDRSAVQKFAIGRMGMMYRKYLMPAMVKRFGTANYNFELDAWTEGFYVTTGRFALQLIKDLKRAELDIGSRWNELSDIEKQNVKRAISEVAQYLMICLACIALSMLFRHIKGLDGPDKDKLDESKLTGFNRVGWYLLRMTYAQSFRLRTQVGALVPNVRMVNEMFTLLKSPMAGITTCETLIDLTKLLWIPNYMDEIESGPYKGHSSAYRALFNSPLVPMYKTVRKWAKPEETVEFYK